MKRLVWDKDKYPLDFFGILTSDLDENNLYEELIKSQTTGWTVSLKEVANGKPAQGDNIKK